MRLWRTLYLLIGIGVLIALLLAAAPPVKQQTLIWAERVLARAYDRATSAITNTARTAQRPDRRPPAHFRFASIQRGTFEQTITAAGSLKPVKTVEVSSQLSGQIAKLYVDFNDHVKKGAPLAQLDQRTYKAKVDEARSALDMARADVHLQEAKLDHARVELAKARANRSVLLARLANTKALKAAARQDVSRKVRLEAHGAVAATALQDAKTSFASKNALYEESQALLSLNAFAVKAAVADVRTLQAQLVQSQSAVSQHEAMLRAAEVDLDRTTIRSPINGIIVGRFVNQGQTLAVGLQAETAFSVAHDLTDMEIHASVDETDIGHIAPGQQATFSVDAYPDKVFHALVRQIRKAPQTSHNVVTYTVVLATNNREGLLLPGMTALVKIVVHREYNVLKMPLAALRFRPGSSTFTHRGNSGKTRTVWIRTVSGDIRPVPVYVGLSSADQVVIKSGTLTQGEQVAVGEGARKARHELFGIKFGS